jgi:hypothetical protein
MTIDTEQYTHLVQQGQDAVRTTIETWTDTVKTVVAQVPALAAQFDAEAAVDRYFDLTEKVLETQRDVTKRLLAAGTSLAASAKA